MRIARVIGVLFLIGAEAILYGYSYPFFSLALEKRELANWLIGFNASLAGAGILIVGPFLPRAIDRLGLSRLVALLFAISAAAFAAILTIDHIATWFVARFVMGICFAAIWTTTEIWLNGSVDDRYRGRIIGGSGTLYAACQFLGPVLLSATGVIGALPLIVAIVPLAAGAVVALFVSNPDRDPSHDEHEADGKTHNLGLAITLAGTILLTAFLTGIGETAMQSLLPLYGLAFGMTDAEASRMVAVFALGEAVMVLVLGWMADRFGRTLTLRVTTMTAALTSLALPFVVHDPIALNLVLFFAGGSIAGLYALCVILIGHDFRGQRLAVVSTGFAMSYSAGSIIGSTPVGLAIDLLGPNALPVLIADAFAGLAIFLLWHEPSAHTAPAPRVTGEPARTGRRRTGQSR